MMTISFSGSLTRSVPLKDSSSFAPCSSTTAVSSLPPPSFSSLFLNASRHCSPNLRESQESEPSATAKLSQLLAIQTIIILRPVFADSGESESSHLPSSEYGYDGPTDLRVRLSFAHCQKPASIEQRRDLR